MKGWRGARSLRAYSREETMRKQMLVTAALACVTAVPAAATQVFDPFASTCTSTDCNSTLIGGTVNSAFNTAGPWVIEVLALANECLRLSVTYEDVDLETVAVAP